MFSSSTVEIHQKLFANMLFLSTRKESMERVAKGKYAYIYFIAYLELIVASDYTDKHGQTNIHISTEQYFPSGYAWAFPKVTSLKFDANFNFFICALNSRLFFALRVLHMLKVLTKFLEKL